MGIMSRSGVYLGIMVMVLLSICGSAKGAGSSGDDQCISAIIPCQTSLNTTGKPPSACCTPLVNAYNNEKACLCALLNDTSLIKAFKVNLTEALLLPTRCGLNADVGSCTNLGKNGTTNSTSSGSSPPSTSNKSALSSPSSLEILSLLALLLLGVAAQVYQ